ncbi:MAG: ferredoxin [Myxococcota bacterium]
MKLRLDARTCVGHGRCYELAPELFGEDERGHSRILRERVPAELAAKAKAAVENCPEKALLLERDED